jgi:type I restriction enzyme R subunit
MALFKKVKVSGELGQLQAVSHAFSFCSTLDDAKQQRDEVALMQAVKVILTKREASAQRKTN